MKLLLSAGVNIAEQHQHNERNCLFLIQLIKIVDSDKGNTIEKPIQCAHINIIQRTQTA